MKLILLTLAFALSLLRASPASACKCEMTSLEDAAAPADAVFDGKVLSIRRSGKRGDLIQLRVSASWKGDVGKIVNVQSGNTSCGLSGAVSRGKRYLVFVSRKGKKLVGHQCQGTRAYSAADADRLTAALGAPRVR